MTKKEFYKEIKKAISLTIDRFYTGLELEDEEELKKETLNSIFDEYLENCTFF